MRIYELKRDAGRYIGRTVTLEGLVGEMLRGGYVDIGAGAQDVIAITKDQATRIENGPVREGKPVRTSGRVEWARDHLLARTPFTFQTPEGPELRSDYSGEPVLIAEEIEVLDVDPADFPKQVGGEPY